MADPQRPTLLSLDEVLQRLESFDPVGRHGANLGRRSGAGHSSTSISAALGISIAKNREPNTLYSLPNTTMVLRYGPVRMLTALGDFHGMQWMRALIVIC